ncbi:PREDICTED: uncharacterized protein LOC104076542 [Fulmarus glacialis]|uniref:uncharacterized protein LOC104076542 n=1 Tax=Fulmarus glacialis TaxID=30455 RepID=UPI00051C9885|nr:PREDICTED: uncharacterized protein LOC104076542 [Fulmarus glacialis]
MGHGAHRGWLLPLPIRSCRVGSRALAGEKGGSPEPAKLPRVSTQDTGGAGNPCCGHGSLAADGCCLPRAWIWNVAEEYALGLLLPGPQHASSLSSEPCCGFWYAGDAPPPAVPRAHLGQQRGSSWGPTALLHCVILLLGERNEHLHRCSQCKVAKYCGKSCQKEAWLDHKQECRCLKSVKPNFPPDSVRLAGRIVFKLLRQSVCLSERLYSFSDLQSNIEQLSEEMKGGLRHLTQTLQLYLKTEIQDASQLPPAIDFFQIFTKVSVKM